MYSSARKFVARDELAILFNIATVVVAKATALTAAGSFSHFRLSRIIDEY